MARAVTAMQASLLWSNPDQKPAETLQDSEGRAHRARFWLQSASWSEGLTDQLGCGIATCQKRCCPQSINPVCEDASGEIGMRCAPVLTATRPGKGPSRPHARALRGVIGLPPSLVGSGAIGARHTGESAGDS